MAYESGIVLDYDLLLSDGNYVSTSNNTYTQGIIVSGVLQFSDGNYVALLPGYRTFTESFILSGVYEFGTHYAKVYHDKNYTGSHILFTSTLPIVEGDTGQIIEVGASCLFTYRVDSPTPGAYVVQFFDRTYGEVTDWSWDFGDTGTSIEENPQHTYTEDGTFLVRLDVTFFGGATAFYQTYITSPSIPTTEVGASYGIGSGGNVYILIPRRMKLDPIDPHKRRDEVVDGLSVSSPSTLTGVGRGGLKNAHGYISGAMKLNNTIRQLRDHVEYEKFLCRTIKDDSRTRQFKKNTQEHPESRYRLIYNNQAVEEHTAAGKVKRRDANRR